MFFCMPIDYYYTTIPSSISNHSNVNVSIPLLSTLPSSIRQLTPYAFSTTTAAAIAIAAANFRLVHRLRP